MAIRNQALGLNVGGGSGMTSTQQNSSSQGVLGTLGGLFFGAKKAGMF
jgi:hypothetical protein